jgi:magnesium-transporting ATPase (P-type)
MHMHSHHHGSPSAFTGAVHGSDREYEILQVNDFNSNRKRMSTVVLTPEGPHRRASPAYPHRHDKQTDTLFIPLPRTHRHTYVRTYICTHMRIRKHSLTHARTHTLTHTCIHTYTHAGKLVLYCKGADSMIFARLKDDPAQRAMRDATERQLDVRTAHAFANA